MAGTRGSGISPVQQEYLDILRSALWGQTPSSIPNDVEGVLAIANLQKTRPLILDALQKAGYGDLAPEAWEVIYRTTSSHITINRAIARLVPFLKESGIDSVLLKGQGVAANYPEPMLRECGDIDLYVGEQQYEKACELMKSLATEDDIANGAEKDKHYHICLDNVHIEIHRFCDTISDKREDRYLQSFATQWLSQDLVPMTINEVSVQTPSDNFNAFFLFFHSWRHFLLEGVGLRQLCDWTLFMHSRAGKLDTTLLGEILKKLNLVIPWQIFATIAVNYLGLPKEEMPFYKAGYEETASRVLSLILQDGNFGHGNPVIGTRPPSFLRGKWFTIKMILKRPIALYRLFPEIRPQILTYAAGEIKAGIKRTKNEIYL